MPTILGELSPLLSEQIWLLMIPDRRAGQKVEDDVNKIWLLDRSTKLVLAKDEGS